MVQFSKVSVPGDPSVSRVGAQHTEGQPGGCPKCMSGVRPGFGFVWKASNCACNLTVGKHLVWGWVFLHNCMQVNSEKIPADVSSTQAREE